MSDSITAPRGSFSRPTLREQLDARWRALDGEDEGIDRSLVAWLRDVADLAALPADVAREQVDRLVPGVMERGARVLGEDDWMISSVVLTTGAAVVELTLDDPDVLRFEYRLGRAVRAMDDPETTALMDTLLVLLGYRAAC